MVHGLAPKLEGENESILNSRPRQPLIWIGYSLRRRARQFVWQRRRWPRCDTDRWAAPVLAAGFGAILLWEELGNLEDTAWLSSCLLLVSDSSDLADW